MSAAKHTEGPWKYLRMEEDSEGWRVMGTTEDGVEGCYCVADVIDGNGSERNEANARLIAAAPDLLEALIRVDAALRAAWSAGNLPASVLPGELASMCGAAIAKATGAPA